MSFETKEAVVAELEQYTENERGLHGQQTSIYKNLATKKARGQYKHDLAVKLFGYLVEAGAKKYAKEFGGTWHQMFTVPIRKAVAENFTTSFEAEYGFGNYDHLLPKKYQNPKQPKASVHARKKIAWKTPESIKIVWSPMNLAYFALWPGRGAIKDQQVLKNANAEDMHDWLRSTYGDAYGIVGRTHATMKHAHARKKLPSQLDREITAHVPSWRGGR
jgi:hypothetical protein